MKTFCDAGLCQRAASYLPYLPSSKPVLVTPPPSLLSEHPILDYLMSTATSSPPLLPFLLSCHWQGFTAFRLIFFFFFRRKTKLDQDRGEHNSKDIFDKMIANRVKPALFAQPTWNVHMERMHVIQVSYTLLALSAAVLFILH